MKILVTGGAGFIGSHLVKKLLSQGHHVITLDDLSTGNEHYLEGITNYQNHTFVHGSVLDRKLLSSIVENCEVIFHMAAVLGVKNTVEEPLKVIEGNIDGTRTILELAFMNNSKVIFASTSEVYGKNTTLPFDEDHSTRVLGSTKTHRWCYATAKALDEHLCFAYATKGLDVAVVRYFNAYGPRQNGSQYGQVVPKFIKAALNNQPLTIYGDGTQTRCFTFITDTVDGTIACLNEKANNDVFNIGNNYPISMVELANTIIGLTNSSSTIHYISYSEAYGDGFEDMEKRTPSIEKAARVLNYHPTIDLEEGLLRTIDWYKQQNVNWDDQT